MRRRWHYSRALRWEIARKLNYLKKSSDDSIHVGDPTKVIDASMSNATTLRSPLLSSYIGVVQSFYDELAIVGGGTGKLSKGEMMEAASKVKSLLKNCSLASFL